MLLGRSWGGDHIYIYIYIHIYNYNMGLPVLSHSNLLEESPSLNSHKRQISAPGPGRNRHPEDAEGDRWFRRCLPVKSPQAVEKPLEENAAETMAFTMASWP